MKFDKTRSSGVLAAELARLYASALQGRLLALDLSPAQFMVLNELWSEDGLTQRDLAGRLGVEQATMANTLARMRRDGLVDRRPHPDDLRSQLAVLTARAKELQGTAIAVAQQVNDIMLAGLPAAERELFLSMLGRVVSAMREHDVEPEPEFEPGRHQRVSGQVETG